MTFARILILKHFCHDWASIRRTNFLLRGIWIFLHVHFGPFRWAPWRYFKILIIYSRKLHFNQAFPCISENLVMLSMRVNDFIVCWAYAETIFSHTESTQKEFSRLLSQRLNLDSFYMDIPTHAEPTEKWFHRLLNNCILPANLSSKLYIYELLTASIHSYSACIHYTWATLYM